MRDQKNFDSGVVGQVWGWIGDLSTMVFVLQGLQWISRHVRGQLGAFGHRTSFSMSSWRFLLEMVGWLAAGAFSVGMGAGWGISLQSDWGALGNIPMVAIMGLFSWYAWRKFKPRTSYDKNISPHNVERTH